VAGDGVGVRTSWKFLIVSQLWRTKHKTPLEAEGQEVAHSPSLLPRYSNTLHETSPKIVRIFIFPCIASIYSYSNEVFCNINVSFARKVSLITSQKKIKGHLLTPKTPAYFPISKDLPATLKALGQFVSE
jgi:hypothetical protein